MPDKLATAARPPEVNAVATLLSHCGIAANMSYNSSCSGSSSSTINDNLAGLQRFFHYNSSSQVTMKYYYTENQWANMLKNDLANNRPIYYCGQSEDNEEEGTVRGGHAFVCDGYNDSNYFHFNWGWNGSCNGFYSLSVLRPLTRYDFTGLQYCILGLEPCHSPMPIMVMGSDLSLSRTIIPLNGTISGRYSITNIGDSVLNCFVGVNIYGSVNQEYYGCVDGRRIIVEPGDTVVCDFSYALQLPEGQYMALMQYSQDSSMLASPWTKPCIWATWTIRNTGRIHRHQHLRHQPLQLGHLRALCRRPRNRNLFRHYRHHVQWHVQQCGTLF